MKLAGQRMNGEMSNAGWAKWAVSAARLDSVFTDGGHSASVCTVRGRRRIGT